MVRFAVIGTSAITTRFLEALAAAGQGAVLQAVYSRTKQRAQAFGAQYGAKAYYDSLQALAADKNVDAVYIASPNSLHCAQALCMLRAGKHVLCEKPMAATAQQARQMFRAAEENGVVLMEAMRSLYTPGFAGWCRPWARCAARASHMPNTLRVTALCARASPQIFSAQSLPPAR